MKRDSISNVGLRKCLFVTMIAGVSLFSSCYNDDSLKDSISNLEQRVDKLESLMSNVQNDIVSLQTLTNALNTNKTIKSVLKTEKGGYVVTLSDDSEVTIPSLKDVESAPQITIKKDDDGEFYWAIRNAEGNIVFLMNGDEKLSVLESTPKVRIKDATNEWEISTDNGVTWQSTGIQVPENAEGTASLFSDVNLEDEDYAYFVLTSGTTFKIQKSKEICVSILSGKLYFAAGTTQTVKVEMSGISKYIVTKPDGWKASLTAEGLNITSPASNNTNAEESGKVSIVAVANNGQSIISDVVVEIGVAPIIITIDDNQNVSTSTKLNGYYLGAVKLKDFKTDVIAQEINDEGYRSPYYKSKGISNVPLSEILGTTPEKGETYMIWAVGTNYAGVKADDIIATYAQTQGYVKLNVSNITFENATVSIIRKGCQQYFTDIVEKEDFDPANIIEDINEWGDYGLNDHNADFFGELTDESLGSVFLTPGKTYILWAMAKSITGEYDESMINRIEIAIPGYTKGGDATVTIGDVTSTINSVSARVDPSDNCYKFYCGYVSEKSLNEDYSTDEELTSYLMNTGIHSNPTVVEQLVDEPGTKGYIAAVALDKNGKLGKVVKKQADAKDLVFNKSISVSVDVVSTVNSATFTLNPTGDVTKYRYLHISDNDFKNYPYWGNLGTLKKMMAGNEKYMTSPGKPNIIEVNKSDLTNNQLTVTGLNGNESYHLYIMAIDSKDQPSEMIEKQYSTQNYTYVRKTDADWTNNKPVVKYSIEKSGAFNNVNYTITPNSNIKEYYVYVFSSSLSGMYDTQIKTVMSSGIKYTGTQSGVANYQTIPTNIYVVCVDNQGRYYEVYTTPVVNP